MNITLTLKIFYSSIQKLIKKICFKKADINIILILLLIAISFLLGTLSTRSYFNYLAREKAENLEKQFIALGVDLNTLQDYCDQGILKKIPQALILLDAIYAQAKKMEPNNQYLEFVNSERPFGGIPTPVGECTQTIKKQNAKVV